MKDKKANSFIIPVLAGEMIMGVHSNGDNTRYWDFFGGAINSGKNIKQEAIRIFKEKTQISFAAENVWHLQSLTIEKELIHIFLAEIAPSPRIVLNSEYSEWAWFSKWGKREAITPIAEKIISIIFGKKNNG